MLRTALTPRFLALLGLVLVVVVAFTFLGLWQLNVARDSGQQEEEQRVAALPTVAVTQVLAPHTVMGADAIGRTVTATGRYDAAHQVLVSPRRLNGQVGSWVVTPLVVDGTGARLAVIRGFVPGPGGAAPATEASAPPAGSVTVAGVLSPPESAPNGDVVIPAGHIASIDLAALVNQWGDPIYNAVVFATQEGAVAGAPTRVPAISAAPAGLSWRNLAYALQWWCFAAFAVYMWWRLVRDAHQAALAAADSGPAPDRLAQGETR